MRTMSCFRAVAAASGLTCNLGRGNAPWMGVCAIMGRGYQIICSYRQSEIGEKNQNNQHNPVVETTANITDTIYSTAHSYVQI